MSVITVIGAGAMGSAFTKPIAENKNIVKLCGGLYDDEIIKNLKEGKEHLKHKIKLSEKIEYFYYRELKESLVGSDVIVLAITSEAIGDVFEKISKYLKANILVCSVTKGYDYDKYGQVRILPDILIEKLPNELVNKIDFVFVAGPCKAIEVLQGVPTSVTYASKNIEAARKMRELAQTNEYRIDITTDVIGTEICAAMKNAYCVGLGMAEGFFEQKGFLHKNTKGSLFVYAIEEMGILSSALGGTLGPVLGLPGIGDLELTGEAGRNRTLGEAIGSGLSASEAIEKMKKNDITVEGYPAIKFGYELAIDLSKQGLLDMNKMPFLNSLYNILYKDEEGYTAIKKLVQVCTALEVSNKKYNE